MSRTFIGCLIGMAAVMVSTARPNSQPQNLAIAHVSIIDVVNGRVEPDSTVTVSGDKIINVVQKGEPPKSSVVVDGRGKFLIPALWDMHTHHQGSGTDSLDLFLANGVVGSRDMGSDADFILPLRDRIRRGELRGPEIVAAGPILDNAPADWPFRRRVTNAEDARAAVRDLKNRGVDFVKVHNHTPRESFFAIADEAAKAGLPFAGHIPLTVSVAEGASSGIKSIEHLSEYRLVRECTGKAMPYERDRCWPVFEKLAAHKVWQTPTITFFRSIPNLFSGKPMRHAEYASDSSLDLVRKNREASKPDAQALTYFRDMSVQSLTVIRDMLALGNSFLAGCDGGVPGFCLHDELEAFTEAGLSPLQALQTATINPARFLGRESTQGTVAAGKRADLVLLDQNPLSDIRNSRHVSAVVAGGRFFSKADIEKMVAARRRRSP
jgi:amidohydrolase family protein